jgi:hypothetical protein
MTNLTEAQLSTIDSISAQVLKSLEHAANEVEINEVTFVLERIALYNIFINVHRRNLDHVYGFWILPNGEVLKPADENSIN